MPYRVQEGDLYFKDYKSSSSGAAEDSAAFEDTFDKWNQQQVIQLINKLFKQLDISNKSYVPILENFIRNYLPKNIHTQQQAALWLGLTLNESGL